MKVVLLLIAILTEPVLVFAQNTWFVRADASPVGADGASWAKATPYLQDALEAAQPGDAVWISEGIYKPSTSGDRYISFYLKNEIRLFGGFAGTESDPTQRDIDSHPTIISGDIGLPGVASDNSFCLLSLSGTNIGTRVDGIIFEDATANHSDNVNLLFFEQGHSGSAIYLNGQNSGNFAYLTIQNCTFRRNWSDYYGAVYANGRNGGKSAVLVENCQFYDNNCGGAGGGLAIDNDAQQQQVSVIRETLFLRNYAHNRGGALLLNHHEEVTIQDCSFIRDSIRFHAGGAVCIEGDFINFRYRFENCLFDQNLTGSGAVGGAFDVEPNYSNLKLIFKDCTFSRHKAADLIWFPSLFGTIQNSFQNCIFWNNTVANLLYFETVGLSGTQQYLNCLFYGTTGAEVLDYYDANDQINHIFQNCLIVKNPDFPLTNGSPKVTMDHCLVSQDNCAALGNGVSCGDGMLFAAKPAFIDAANGDFHLQPCSPAINAGDNSTALAAGLSADAAGQPRILNNTVDLGPYEHDLFLASLTMKPASCTDVRDGSITVGGYFCPPLTMTWDNGVETGDQTDSLAAGTYVFSFSDGSGYAETDTLVVPSLSTLLLTASATNVTCFGMADGIASLNASGGTPPYQFSWANGDMSGFLFNLPPGDYPATVTDAKGCTATEVVTITDPGLIQVFYTVTPASAQGKADGQIHIDSLIGCDGPFQWPAPDMINLSPGAYTVTVTDPCGCIVVVPVAVGVATGVSDGSGTSMEIQLMPNPTLHGQPAKVAGLSGSVETVMLQDASGRILQLQSVPHGATDLNIIAPEAPGIYWLTMLDGRRGHALRWLVH